MRGDLNDALDYEIGGGHRSAPSQTHPVTRSATTRVASGAVLLTRETTDYGNTGGTGAPPPKPTPSRDPRQRGSLRARCCSRARRQTMETPGAQERPLPNPPRHAIRDNAGRFARGAAHARDDRLWKHRGHRSAPSQTHPVTRSATTRVALRVVLLTRETRGDAGPEATKQFLRGARRCPGPSCDSSRRAARRPSCAAPAPRA